MKWFARQFKDFLLFWVLLFFAFFAAWLLSFTAFHSIARPMAAFLLAFLLDVAQRKFNGTFTARAVMFYVVVGVLIFGIQLAWSEFQSMFPRSAVQLQERRKYDDFELANRIRPPIDPLMYEKAEEYLKSSRGAKETEIASRLRRLDERTAQKLQDGTFNEKETDAEEEKIFREIAELSKHDAKLRSILKGIPEDKAPASPIAPKRLTGIPPTAEKRKVVSSAPLRQEQETAFAPVGEEAKKVVLTPERRADINLEPGVYRFSSDGNTCIGQNSDCASADGFLYALSEIDGSGGALSEKRYLALLGRINGDTVYVGAEKVIRVDAPGSVELFLNISPASYSDIRGRIITTISKEE